MVTVLVMVSIIICHRCLYHHRHYSHCYFHHQHHHHHHHHHHHSQEAKQFIENDQECHYKLVILSCCIPLKNQVEDSFLYTNWTKPKQGSLSLTVLVTVLRACEDKNNKFINKTCHSCAKKEKKDNKEVVLKSCCKIVYHVKKHCKVFFPGQWSRNFHHICKNCLQEQEKVFMA